MEDGNFKAEDRTNTPWEKNGQVGTLSDSFDQKRARTVPSQRRGGLVHVRNTAIVAPWRPLALCQFRWGRKSILSRLAVIHRDNEDTEGG